MNTFHTQMLSIWLLRVLCRPWYSVGMQIGTIAKVIVALAHVIRLVGWLKRVKPLSLCTAGFGSYSTTTSSSLWLRQQAKCSIGTAGMRQHLCKHVSATSGWAQLLHDELYKASDGATACSLHWCSYLAANATTGMFVQCELFKHTFWRGTNPN